MYTKRSFGPRFFFELFKIGVLALIIVTVFRAFLAEPFIVSGDSMEPTYRPGDYLIIDRLSYRFAEPRRGDVIIFQYPLDPALYFIKRIEGLPGETVDANTGALLPPAQKDATGPPAINGLSYAEHATSTITLASDEYFVLGDNAKDSSDSRQWGPLQKKFIVGRVVFRAWPL